MPTRQELFDVSFYRPVLFNGIRIVFIVIFAYIATVLAARIFHAIRTYVVRVMLKTQGGTEYEIQKRAETVADVVRKSIVAMIWVVALIMILKEMNFDVRPLLAGAGVVAVAIGLGAQSLIKDVLGGFFLLLEDQIRINDVAVINGTGGLVEAINLRTTILRAEDGAVHVFPNGSITKLANLTRDFSYAVFSIGVNYKENTDQVVFVLKEIGAALAAEEAFKDVILAPLEIYGIDQLGDSAVIIKGRFKTLPMKQWMVGRELNRRIKMKFDEVGIDMPFPTRSVHVDQDWTPQIKEQLKEVVREVLKEHAAR